VNGHDLLSEGVVDGSIQVPGSGQPVILIADHPTVGGYPKIATAISADMAAIGRLRIGSTVRFEAVDEASAARARRDERAWFESVRSEIRDGGR
jgi:allophanate hydrolase subunit 2